MSETSIQNVPDPGLPPVKPPSGRFIIQLFLVPGLLVGLIVVVLLFFQWILGGPRSPEQFLKGLDNPNPEVRWRAAADLAQVLPRDNEMALNVDFALALSERLRRALKDNNASEKVWHEQRKEHKDDPPPAPKPLRAEREHIWYLTACLGNFQVPVTVPLLQEIAEDNEGWDAEATFRKRTLAVNALTVMGNNLKKFDKLSEDTRQKVLNRLKEESESPGKRGRWASDTLTFLQARQEGRPAPTLQIASTLIEVASDPSPFLRKQAAGALTNWDGDKVDEVLLRLTRDDGKGEDPVQWDKEQQEYRAAHPEEVQRLNRLDIRYNAALSLARRGSPLSAGLMEVYEEMLDLKKQEKIWTSENPSHQGSAEARAVEVVIFTLSALDQLLSARPEIRLDPSLLDPLVGSNNKAIRSSALELQKKLK